jgi:hypothetical protein
MTAWLLSQALPWLIGGLFALAAMFGWRRSIRRGVKAETALQAAEAATESVRRNKDNLERMANVPVLDADRSREWLHSRDHDTK